MSQTRAGSGLRWPACLSGGLREVADRARHAHDSLFWQWPGRTEGAAHALHAALPEARFERDQAHVYLGMPWATWLDRRRVDAEQAEAMVEFEIQRVRIRTARRTLAQSGLALRVHSVCQHIEWPALVPLWQRMGMTDLWLSHAPPQGTPAPTGLRWHPWRLLAVNVEDPQRRAGLRFGADWDDKPLLASFVGAHADHYLSDVRLRLRELAAQSDMHIRVSGGWHFENVVYRHQVGGAALAESYAIDGTVHDYNRLLSDSRFALCPSGAGPNTLRLWEALAVGSVPVLLGVCPELPEGPDWDAIVLKVSDAELATLPERLRRIDRAEWRRRQQAGMAAFDALCRRTCF